MKKNIKFPATLLICLLSGMVMLAAVPFRSGSVIKESQEALARNDFKKALSLADSVITNSNNSLSKLEALQLCASAYAGLGQPAKADEAFQEVMEQSKLLLGDDSDGHLNALFNYAQFLNRTGRYEESLRIIDSVEVPNEGEYAANLNGLKASTLMWLGKYDEALVLLDSLVKSVRPAGETDLLLGVLLQNRGFLKSRIKNKTGAINDYKEALTYLSGKNKAATLANLALEQARNQEYSEALENVEKAIDSLKDYGDTDEDYVIAIRKKAEILQMSGKEKEAADVIETFFNLERNRLETILPTLSPQARLDYWTKEKPLLSKVFLTAETNPTLAFDAALMRRQTSLMGSNDINLVNQRLKESHKDISKRLKRNEAAVAFVVYEDENGGLQNAALTITSNGLISFLPLFPQDSLQSTYAKDISLYEAIVSPDPYSKNILYSDSILGNKLWKPIIDKLPDNITAIHFAPEGIFHLWGIENMPFEGAGNISLIRHFALNDINNETTDSNGFGKVLIGGGFDYDSSSSSQNNDKENAEQEAYKEILRATNINEGERIFQYLPGTLKETTRISNIYPQGVFTTELTEEELKSKPIDWELIHLATHGYTLSNNIDLQTRQETDTLGYDMTLWQSGLALTGANVAALNGSEQDGILSAREICDLDLSATKLVVLSACQTAQGTVTDESASGLIRALKNAGASTIVASLWEVDDESTALFMNNFHSALASGLTKSEAFREAQLKTRKHAVEQPVRKFKAGALASRPTGELVSQSPYNNAWYWAPFIIIDP